MKRLMLVWVMILCLVPLGGWAERTAPTQPPTPPPEMPVSTPRSIGVDENASANYDFPTAVDGYVFISFAGESPLDRYSDAEALFLWVVCRYFEEVYPGCTLEQLRDFVIQSPDYARAVNSQQKVFRKSGKRRGIPFPHHELRTSVCLWGIL